MRNKQLQPQQQPTGGISLLPIRDVAKRLGISRGHVYWRLRRIGRAPVRYGPSRQGGQRTYVWLDDVVRLEEVFGSNPQGSASA